MACEVTVRDIQNRIKNQVLDRFDSAKFTKYQDSIEGFIPFDASNPNNDVLFGKVKIFESQMNTLYNSDVHGKVVTYIRKSDGYVISIHPSRKLADAMTLQNVEDEAIAYRVSEAQRASLSLEEYNQYNNSEFEFASRRDEEPQKPIGDNYGEFVRYKQNQLELIDEQITRLRRDLRNTNINTTIDKRQVNLRLRKLQQDKQKISLQLEQLAKNESDIMFHAITEDLKDIKESFDNLLLVDTQAIGQKIDFYDEFVSGNSKEYKGESLRVYDNPAFGDIKTTIDELKDLYKNKLLETARKYIEEDIFVQDTLTNNDVKLDDLLQAQGDINWLEQMFLGITADRTNNTVIPQVIMSQFKQTYARNFTNYIDFARRFNELIKTTGLKDFDFIIEKDSSGNPTGFITDVFSPEWYKILRRFEGATGKFLSDYNADNYKEVTKIIKDNIDVIDFTKLSEVREVYQDMYPQYFTDSVEASEEYERDIRERLGPRYQDVLNQILDRLARFEEFKVDAQEGNPNYIERNIAQNNIWEFNRLVKGRAIDSRIPYNYNGGRYGVYFTGFRDLAFIPKKSSIKAVYTDLGVQAKEVKTGFYNEDFQDIISDPQKLEYWKLVKEMSEYINSTYNLRNHGRLSYPKVQEDYAERFFDSLKDIRQGKFMGGSKILTQAMHQWKGFFFEEGKHTDEKSNVSPNYFDATGKEIKDLAESYIITGMSREQAYTQARSKVLSGYSTDFNRDILGVVMEATLHNTRLEMQPISEALIAQFKDLGSERKRAIEKIEYWHEKVILNRGENYRGSSKIEGKSLSPWFNRAINILSSVPFVKKFVNEKSAHFLTDSEKEVFKGLQQAKELGHPANDFSFKHNDMIFSKKTTEKDNGEIDIKFYEGIGKDVKEITEDAYNRMFNDYIEQKIKSLGLDFSLAGFIQGVLKTVIYKSLGFNPISGIFNRIEGKHSAMVMDMTGEYWPTGAIDKANQFLSFANIIRMSPNKLLPKDMVKRREIEKFQLFLRQMNTLQDRKNELQKNSQESKFNAGSFNLFALAVDNPEFKNQGGIILSMMYGKEIKDVDGNSHKLFDGNSLVPYDLVDGNLQLKPKFDTEENRANLLDFSGKDITKLKIRMEDAVSRSQGNYDIFDIMMAKRNIWGRAATLFMTWFPEHVNQRFGVNSENNVSIFTGKKRRDGRFIAAYKGNKANAAMYALGTLAISYGTLGTVGLAATGALSAIVYQKFLRKIANPQGVKRDVNYAMEMVEFLKSTLIETLNYPGRLLNVSDRLRVKNKSFENTTMSEEEIGALRALTRELAIMLSFLAFKLAVGALAYDDEDDAESPERMRYNFAQNQLSRAINSLAIYSNPQELVTDNSRVAALSTLSSISKILSAIYDEKQREDLGTNFMNLTPVPRILTKGELPWENKKNYDEVPSMIGISSPLKWTSDFIKDQATDGEYSAEKEYKKLRKDARSRYRSELSSQYEGDQLEEAIEKAMTLEFPDKERGESNKSILNRIEAGEKGKLKKASKTTRNNYKDRLKEEGLTNEEIAERMAERFRGR